MTVNQVRAFVFIEGDDGPLLLLTRRKFPPYTGKLSLPGGFVKSGMTSAETIRYKLERETSLKVEESQLHSFKVKSTKYGDPRGDFLCEYFLAVLPKQSLELNEEESKEKSEFYYLDEIEELGFDHGAILCELLGSMWGEFPLLPVPPVRISLPELFGPKDIDFSKKVVFYGGTFNPWHHGHMACVELCPNQNLVIVTDSNPWKLKDKTQIACDWREYREIALKFERTRIPVFPGYKGMTEGNPTVDWLPSMSGTKEILLGLDSFENLPQWKDSKKLLENLKTIYVTPRNFNQKASSKEIEKQLKSLNPKIKIQHLPDHEFKDVNSTALREENQ